ncbi:EAL domain-containing response regulator [Halomonas sp. YLGW01]|uniref:EAL domain-containing response regulator n=1 Tax=Halomonas sp. YLGW01 TaxID=2773308 RepID=UPI00177FACEE|nr:EAL domain-containing response regulator [Halomonas sp. YLGW01]
MPMDEAPLAVVVDTDLDVVVALSLHLRTLGLETHHLEQPCELLACLSRLRPRLVILDLEIDGEEGIDILRHLAEAGYRGAVMLLSGVNPKVMRIAERMGRTLGLLMLDSLSKPYRLDGLRDSLEGLQMPPHDVMSRQGDQGWEREEIKRALADEEFQVHYQPQFDLGSQDVSGVEVLVRWQHPRLGLLWPSRFLHLMTLEQSRLMTRQIVTQVALDARRWQAAGHQLSVSINVSPNELIHGELVPLMDELQRSLGRRLPLVLEITESDAMQDELLGSEIAARLHLLGMELSVDDFGIGFSSLARLQLLPISEVKIDRGFVRHLDDNPQDAAIVEAVALLGQRLGIRVVAEGVESLESLIRLSRFGCTHAQGFALAKPMPVDRLIDLLASLGSHQAPSVQRDRRPALGRHDRPRLVSTYQ